MTGKIGLSLDPWLLVFFAEMVYLRFFFFFHSLDK